MNSSDTTGPLTLTLPAQRTAGEPVWLARLLFALTVLIGFGLAALLVVALGVCAAGLVIVAALLVSGTVPVPITCALVAVLVVSLMAWGWER